jgi:hypothetical protein
VSGAAEMLFSPTIDKGDAYATKGIKPEGVMPLKENYFKNF